MTTLLKVWRAVALFAMMLLCGPASAEPAGTGQCFSDWSAAASVVAEEKLVTVEALGRQFRRQNLGEIVRTELCREAGQYVYRLVVRSPNGRFGTAIYDARRGIEIGVAETGR